MNRWIIAASVTTPNGEQWIASREGNVFDVRISTDGKWVEWQLKGEEGRWQAVPLDRAKYIIYEERRSG